MYLVDTNIFLEILLKQARKEECKALLNELAWEKISGIITDFAIDSIAIQLESKGRSAQDIKIFLTSLLSYEGLRIHSMAIEEKLAAADIMQHYKLDFDDSIQLQAMFSNNVIDIISFDTDFDKVKEIKRVEPKDILNLKE